MTGAPERFELLEALGTGGVAEVWRARDTTTGQEVALKLLLAQLAEDRQVRRRFLREAEIAGRLEHPGIVRVLDVGEVAGRRPFLAMELVRGEDLGRRLDREGRLSHDESWRIAIALAEALGHAHARGIVHRDVKPQNVLLDGTAVKLADFGLARIETLASLTGSSLVWGSPEYMAPELFTRGRADPRTDLFSLGVVIHEMVTGRLPWKDGRSPARIVAAADSPPVQYELGQGEVLDNLVSALLAPSPDNRPSSAAEVIGQLRGDLPVAPLVRTVACPSCGCARPEDVPRCLACGHEDLMLRHTPEGGWDVLLLKTKDDAESMEIIHRVISELVGRKDLRLKFLVGLFNSPKEQNEAIQLPVALFSELDEATAQEIASRLVGRGIKACASRRRALGRFMAEKTKPGLIAGGGIAAWTAILPLLNEHHGPSMFRMVAFPLCSLGLFAAVNAISAARTYLRTPGRFRLRARSASTPEAERLLGAAQRTGAELAAPEVRALFVETSRALFRLTRRAEQLATTRPAGSSEEALARRLLAAAPALSARLDSAVRRLETLDAALEADSEGDTLRALGALDRRRAGVAAADLPGLEQTGRELEAALDRRLAAETEREQLAASLCRLLAAVRDLYHRAAALSTAEERETAAIEQALLELEAEQRGLSLTPEPAAIAASSGS